MNGVLNERTRTVHKHETGATALHTTCGVTFDLDPDKLREIPVEQAATEYDARRCGRCFDGVGGY